MDLLAQPAVRVFAFWYLILALKMLMLIFRTSATTCRPSAICGTRPLSSTLPLKLNARP